MDDIERFDDAFEGMLLGATAIVHEPLSIFPPTSLSTFEDPDDGVMRQDLVTAFSRVLNGEFDGASSQAERGLLSELCLAGSMRLAALSNLFHESPRKIHE